jgi:hypothetical protein
MQTHRAPWCVCGTSSGVAKLLCPAIKLIAAYCKDPSNNAYNTPLLPHLHQPSSTTIPPGLPTALDSNHLHPPPHTPHPTPPHPNHSLPCPNTHDSPTASPKALDVALGSAPLRVRPHPSQTLTISSVFRVGTFADMQITVVWNSTFHLAR